MNNYRFAFDLGTTSIGWAVFELDTATGKPVALARTNKKNCALSFPPMGVRIFDDGMTSDGKASKASARREPRGARRGQDRRLARRARLLSDLEAAGWLPPKGPERNALFALNPYELRARAAREQVSLSELGRALWHISKHRGFKSNRKTDKPQDDTGLIKSAQSALKDKLKDEGHDTYGAYLWARLESGQGVRIRPRGENTEKHYEFFPTRQMLIDEFNTLWNEQAKHHDLPTDLRDRLRDHIIFYQRPLKPVEVGRCTFFPDQDRLAKWHPAAQAFLILQDLSNLRINRGSGDESLDLEQRKVLFDTLNSGVKLTWTAVRKALNCSTTDKINLQDGGLPHLHFNMTAANLVGTKKKPGPLAAHWAAYTAKQREGILEKMADTQVPDELITGLIAEYALDEETAKAVERVSLPDKHLRFCKDVTQALVAEMRSDAIDYTQAIARAPLLSGADLSHSDFRPDRGVDLLPRYNELEHLQRMLGNGTGNPDDPHDIRYGKVTNPTVHIALGQFRRVMNMLIQEFGKPSEVVLESARELGKSKDEKDKLAKQNNVNKVRNDRYRKELEEAGLFSQGQRVGDLFLKMRLWEELGKNEADRRSPFTGRHIGRADLLSDAVEIEHILPFADTLDDSPANKTLAFRKENKDKQKLSPADAAARGIFDQDRMIELSKPLPRNKAWRFLPDAMEMFEDQKSFMDRQLHATGYLARIVRAYAEALFDKTDEDGQRRSHVWMLPGQITAMLRHRWGLYLGDHNTKNRNDHRHHAIDAAVIGVIDRAMINRLQRAAKSVGAQTLSRVLPTPPEPFEGYRDQVMAAVERINVSHRAKHGSADPNNSAKTSGQLHEATAFGLVKDNPENQADLTIGNVVVRKPVTALTDKEIHQIRDLSLRNSALCATEASRKAVLSKREADQLRAQLLSQWSDDTGHRRVRVLKREASVRAIHDKTGKAYKWYAPGENAFVDIIEVEGRWLGHAQSVWDANSGQQQSWQDLHPDGTFIMRVHKEDTLQLFAWDDDEGQIVAQSNCIKRVVRLAPSSNLMYLCGLNDAGKLQQRHEDSDDEFRWDFANFDKLRLRRARRVRIDELGRVHTIPHGKILNGTL